LGEPAWRGRGGGRKEECEECSGLLGGRLEGCLASEGSEEGGERSAIESFINQFVAGVAVTTMATYAVTDPEKRFFLHGGGELSSLEDLFTELQTMEDHVYAHHVNEERNDFSRWVREVMGDHFLAKKIELARDRDELLKCLFISLFR